MFQSIITSQYKNQFDKTNELHTDTFYRFFYAGGLVTGKVVRVGEKVSISTLTLGMVEIDTLEFLSNNPQKL